MLYEEQLRSMFGDEWPSLSADERDGAYGVAIVRAVLDGADSKPESIAYRLLSDMLFDDDGKPILDDQGRETYYEPTPDEVEDLIDLIEVPLRRLHASGIFSKRFNLRRDKCLNGYSSFQDGRTAWCCIAGMASGYIGQGYYITYPDNQRPKQ